MELHDRLMVGIRTERLELDEAWSFVGKKQKNVKRHEINAKGDQYVFIGMAGTQKAIISWGVGKRNTESTCVSEGGDGRYCTCAANHHYAQRICTRSRWWWW